MTASPAQQPGIACVWMRGGTSKAAFFDAADLPPQGRARDAVLLAAMGHQDSRQIDGIGGGTPLTTKVAIVSPSLRDDSDVDYLFAQILPAQSRVDYAPTCGNILAAVGPYAIEHGWVPAQANETAVRIFMVNTQARCTAMVPTDEGTVRYVGPAHISGVPGTASAIFLHFADIVGSSCGSLFPTGYHTDHLLDTEVTCIDHGMPVVIIRADDCGITGYESPADLDGNVELKGRIESIRLLAGERMGLGDVSDKVIPKVTLVASPREGGICATRTFIPHRCHDAIGVLGAVSVATSMLYADTVTASLSVAPPCEINDLTVEHPTGDFGVRLMRDHAVGDPVGAALMRTARALFRGHVLLPPSLEGSLKQLA
jgi:4-oxalomesaconate tautomerase